MRNETAMPDFRQRGLIGVRLALLTRLLLGLSLLLVSGCGGCNRDPDEEDKQAKKEQPKPSFQKEIPVFLPGNFENPIAVNRSKVGHWASVQLNCVSNRQDFTGDLHTFSVIPGTNNLPAPVSGTEFYLESSRPVSLPQEQWKYLETTLYMPNRAGATQSSFTLSLYDRNGLAQNLEDSGFNVNLMVEHQHHFVVLTQRPASKQYLKDLSCIQLPSEDAMSQVSGDLEYINSRRYYLPVFSEPNRGLPLPSRSLTWTTIAYVLWDDVRPGELTVEQQAAMLDWLHWGGQLIVNGPAGLAGLEDSFLADYLPCVLGGPVNLVQSDFAEWNQNWAVPEREGGGRHTLDLPGETTIFGVSLKLTDRGAFVPGTGELVAESRVGRGGIVVSGVTLDQLDTTLSCQSFASFFNGALMRRPGRRFSARPQYSDADCDWRQPLSVLTDPLLATRLRYVSRDLGEFGTAEAYEGSAANWEEAAEQEAVENGDAPLGGAFPGGPADDSMYTIAPHKRKPQQAPEVFGGYNPSPGGGVAAWNDQSAISNAARQTLLEAAGIVPPSRNFVMRMLLIYLVVLVPVNWVVFKCLGRVEWAWVAAPILAVLGGIGVARYASLDIGFVRASNSVGVLELHGGYARGHLTNYTALYTSLSTKYDVTIRDGSALVLPFAKSSNAESNVRARPVQLRIGREIGFNNFPIDSNSTRLFHSENMVNVGGAIYLANDGAEVVNDSRMALKDVGLLRRQASGQLQFSWIGQLDAAAAAPLQWQDIDDGQQREPWASSPQMYSHVRHAQKLGTEMIRRSIEDRQRVNGLLEPEELEYAIQRQVFGYQEFIDAIREDPGTSERWEDYRDATLRCPSIPRAELAKFPGGLELDLNQIADICELALGDTQLRLGLILDPLTGKLELAPGECRLIGWTEGSPGQSEIKPRATQSVSRTVVLVHLQHPAWRAAEPDANVYSDFAGQFEDLDLEEGSQLDGVEMPAVDEEEGGVSAVGNRRDSGFVSDVEPRGGYRD